MKRFTRLSIKHVAVVATLSLTLLTGITLTHAFFAKRDFSGRTELLFCKRSASNQWEVFDKITIPNLSFSISVADIAFGKEIRSTDSWEGRTEKGKRFRFTLGGPGKAKLNQSGNLVDVEVELPFNITIEGKSFSRTFRATTGTAQGAFGTISGKRGIIDSNAHTFTFGLVGSNEILVDASLIQDGTSNTAHGLKNGFASNSTEAPERGGNRSAEQRILVVGTIDGKLKAGN